MCGLVYGMVQIQTVIDIFPRTSLGHSQHAWSDGYRKKTIILASFEMADILNFLCVHTNLHIMFRKETVYWSQIRASVLRSNLDWQQVN